MFSGEVAVNHKARFKITAGVVHEPVRVAWLIVGGERIENDLVIAYSGSEMVNEPLAPFVAGVPGKQVVGGNYHAATSSVRKRSGEKPLRSGTAARWCIQIRQA